MDWVKYEVEVEVPLMQDWRNFTFLVKVVVICSHIETYLMLVEFAVIFSKNKYLYDVLLLCSNFHHEL